MFLITITKAREKGFSSSFELQEILTWG